MGNTRGAVLLITMVTGLLIAIGIWGLLTLVGSGLRRGAAFKGQGFARYAAEAGLVYALQKLEEDPTWSSGAGSDLTIDGVGVDILLVPCVAIPPAPCEARAVEVTVDYDDL